MTQQLTIEAPAVFKPLDQPSRYKGLWGAVARARAGTRPLCLCCVVSRSPAFYASLNRTELIRERMRWHCQGKG
jgi:hypothetical protein